MFRDLRGFLEALEERGLLRRVGVELSPVLEIPEVLRRVMEAGGPAVLFERVKGYPGWRVVGNLFGGFERLRLALGVERFEEVGERLVPPLVAAGAGVGLREKLRGLAEALGMARFLPRSTGRPSFRHTVLEGGEARLSKLPLFKCWPRDGGRYITFGQVYTVDPRLGVVNIGVYRVMEHREGMVLHWQLHKRGQLAYWHAVEEGRELPVAVVVGSDPYTMLAGVLPLPYPFDKLLFAGLLAGRGVEVYRLPNGVPVPAHAEVVVEGFVEPGRLAEEGPFGDHWGYYDKPRRRFPLARVERIWLRENPVYVGTVVGRPVKEDAYLGKLAERLFLPLLKTMLPEIVDLNLPAHGVFHGIAFVSIRKRYPGHAKKVMMALWGLGQLSLTKIIVVVDHDVDVHDLGQVLWAIAAHVDPERDVVVVPGAHLDELDPSTPTPGYGGKLGIDATRKLPEERMGAEWPEPVEPNPETARRIDELWPRLGLGGGAGHEELLRRPP